MPTITSLRTQYPAGLIGVDADPIRLTWQIDAQVGTQTRAEIQTSADSEFATFDDQREVAGPSQIAVVAPGGPFNSREIRYFRVRSEIDGAWTGWSPACSVEIGLLDAADWSAKPIGLEGDTGADEMAPAPLLRRTFSTAGPVQSARLYATSHGVHDLYLSGSKVGEDLLAPGWSTYGRRLVSCTYDVTELLSGSTEHVLGASLGDGWFRGRLGWERGKSRCRYGTELALLAQLEIIYQDGTTETIGTDSTWVASTGAVQKADIYDGCEIDFNKLQAGWSSVDFDDSAWPPAKSSELDLSLLEPWISAPIRPFRTLEVSTSAGPDG